MKKALVALSALAASSPVYAISVVSLHGGVSMAPPVANAGVLYSFAGVLVLAGAVAWRFAWRRVRQG